MIPEIRKAFNQQFTPEKYEAFLQELNSFHGPAGFRVAETPVFVPKVFLQKMLDTCEAIVDVILQPDFIEKTNRAIPPQFIVPNESKFPHFIAFDFGVCTNENGEYEPQLIEMQGFPTLFAYQLKKEEIFKNHFELPDNFDSRLENFQSIAYLQLLKEIITGNHNPENVILLELFPEQQKTNIDFYFTQDFLGIEPVCVTTLIKEGKQLFYMKDGKKTPIKRIYNRLIFDELSQQPEEIRQKVNILFEELDVEWVPHPAWFYRVSKFTLPLIDHPNIPKTWYLNELQTIPPDLENYVLKPLFSFAGQGVVIDVTEADIKNVPDPENWILQKKVNYAAAIETPDEPAKAEIRLFYFWKDGAARPVPTNDLARLSKGKMIGVRYNKDKTWTGSSFCIFEK